MSATAFSSMPPSWGEPSWLVPAKELGHNFCPDPPGVSVEVIRRWLTDDPEAGSQSPRFTCRSCGNTALKFFGSPYGSAFERECTGKES